VPYPVRYNEAATAEIEIGIRWSVIKIGRVFVLACMQHHQKPWSLEDLLGPP